MIAPTKVKTAALSSLLLIGAIMLYANVPTLQESYAPVAVRGDSSGETKGRNNAISIRGAYSAPALKYTFKDRSQNFTERTQGRWIVLDVEYRTLRAVQDYIMYLMADDLRIQAQRSRARTFDQPGIPERLTLVFDVHEQPRALSLIVKSLPGARNSDVGAARGWGIETQLDVRIPVSSVIQRDVLNLHEGKLAE